MSLNYSADPTLRTHLVQVALNTLGYPCGEADNVNGPKTTKAYQKFLDDTTASLLSAGGVEYLKGDGTWPFLVKIDGEDLVIEDARVTCFGGANDKMDSGDTASGISTKDPSVLGCALPRNYTGKSSAQLKALGGSPIPNKLPFKSPVKFTWGNQYITVPFIDVGPAKWTKNEGDLTVAAAKKFKPNATANSFEITGVEIRMLGAAKYVT